MRNGYGILYFKNNKILYKGYWCDNMTHGYGEEYDINQNIIYKGMWKYNEKI